MAIGTTAAILGATAISAGASVLGGRSQSRAIERGADAQAQAASEANDLNREIYYDQTGRLEPFRQLGISAIGPLSDLMGLDYQTGQGQAQPGGQSMPFNPQTLYPQSGGQQFNPQSYLDANPGLMTAYQQNDQGLGSPEEFARVHWDLFGQQEGRTGAFGPVATNGPVTATDPTAVQPTGAERTMSAMDALRERPGYNFRFNEGQRAVDGSAAARGMTMSGAQLRAQTQYGQNFATAEYDNEINRLLAVMGGGQVATNNQNQAAGNFGALSNQNTINQGNNRASAYGAQGANRANTIGGVGSALAGGFGMYGGSQGWFGNGG